MIPEHGKNSEASLSRSREERIQGNCGVEIGDTFNSEIKKV